MIGRTALRPAFAFVITLLLSATAQAQLFRAYLHAHTVIRDNAGWGVNAHWGARVAISGTQLLSNADGGQLGAGVLQSAGNNHVAENTGANQGSLTGLALQ